MTASDPEINLAQAPDVKWAQVPINPLFADDVLPIKVIHLIEEPPGKLISDSSLMPVDASDINFMSHCRDSSALHTSCTVPAQQANLEHRSHIPLLSIIQHIWQLGAVQRGRDCSVQPCTV